jgi:hypothetical protein
MKETEIEFDEDLDLKGVMDGLVDAGYIEQVEKRKNVYILESNELKPVEKRAKRYQRSHSIRYKAFIPILIVGFFLMGILCGGIIPSNRFFYVSILISALALLLIEVWLLRSFRFIEFSPESTLVLRGEFSSKEVEKIKSIVLKEKKEDKNV